MQTMNTTARHIIRGWAEAAVVGYLTGGGYVGDYKEAAEFRADAIRERAMSLQDNSDLGASYDEDTIEAMTEVRDHMPCGCNSPRTFWEWYNS